MPRKKANMLDAMLDYVTNAPLAAVDVVMQLCGTIVRNRHGKEDPPTVEKVVRRAKKIKPTVAEPAFSQAHGLQETPVAMPPAMSKPRTRRMRADSPPPVREATPIVPLQEEVGGDADEAYTGE